MHNPDVKSMALFWRDKLGRARSLQSFEPNAAHTIIGNWPTYPHNMAGHTHITYGSNRDRCHTPEQLRMANIQT